MNYKESGVDIEKGDLFIERIKPFIKNTYTENVVSGVGGFAALYEQGDRYLASGTDGVGTKLKLATELNTHDTIGQDLVAMCVNDILCTGAKPMFFLDYLATSQLNLETHQNVIKGIAQACSDSGCALIGGETAEMPGMYQNNEYDLAGFVVGDVSKKALIDGKSVKAGMKIYAFTSSGFHSNGLSLVRALLKDNEQELKRKVLTPTKLYVKDVLSLLEKVKIHGMAHITGGGLNNIKRINSDFGYEVTNLPTMPEFMDIVISRANLSLEEMYQTFNMGVGFTLVVSENIELEQYHPDLIQIGTVSSKFQGVKVLNTPI